MQVCDLMYFTMQFCCRLEPPKWSDVARSGEDITTTHCEAYELENLSHEYEDLSEYQSTEYEIPITRCHELIKSFAFYTVGTTYTLHHNLQASYM